MLQELASYVGGNRSLVFGRRSSSTPTWKIAWNESRPTRFPEDDGGVRRAIREGRVTPHEEVVRKSKALAKRSAKKRNDADRLGGSGRDLVYELPVSEQNAIFEHWNICHFPHMYPVRFKGRRFRRHRWFQAGSWLVYYRVVRIRFIRGIWPARIP